MFWERFLEAESNHDPHAWLRDYGAQSQMLSRWVVGDATAKRAERLWTGLRVRRAWVSESDRFGADRLPAVHLLARNAVGMHPELKCEKYLRDWDWSSSVAFQECAGGFRLTGVCNRATGSS